MNPSPSTQKAFNLVTAIVFIISVAACSYLSISNWASTIYLCSGIAIVVRQLLQAKMVDVLVYSVVFGGSFIFSFMNLLTRVFVPTLLVVGAIYFALRLFFEFGQEKKVKTNAKNASTDQLLREAREVHRQHEHHQSPPQHHHHKR